MRWLALVVLAFAFSGCGGGGSGSDAIEVELRDVRSFEPVGTVTLEERDGGTRVEVSATGLQGASSPAIRGGFCAELRPREHKLTEFENGRSVTDVDVPLDDLLARQSKVTVSRGENTPHRVVACTELPFEGEEPEVAIADLVGPGMADKGLGWFERAGPERTRVGILLYDVVPGPQPAAIVRGGCRGQAVHELTEIRDSESVTVVDAPLDELADGNYRLVAGTTCGPIAR